jgi:hypothetical protein
MVVTKRQYIVRFTLLLVCLFSSFQAANAQETGSNGIWMSEEELSRLPATGDSWDKMMSYARNHTNDPDLKDQDDKTDTNTVAKALVYARTGDTTYAEEVVYTLQRLIELNPISRSLDWDELGAGRSIGSYAMAADLIDLKNYAPDFDKNHFRPWLDKARFADTEGGVVPLLKCTRSVPIITERMHQRVELPPRFIWGIKLTWIGRSRFLRAGWETGQPTAVLSTVTFPGRLTRKSLLGLTPKEARLLGTMSMESCPMTSVVEAHSVGRRPRRIMCTRVCRA